MEILYELLNSTNSVAIVASHSAYVVREVTRENVKVMIVDDHKVTIDTPRMQTFGSSIDTISQFVFGDTNINHYFQNRLLNIAENFGRENGIEAVVERFGKQLNPESLSFIAKQLRD